MKMKCPHCKHENEAERGELRRCDKCGKAYEHGKKDIKPPLQLSEKRCAQCLEKVNIKASVCKYCGYRFDALAVDIEETQYANGLSVAKITGFIGYGVAILALLVGGIILFGSGKAGLAVGAGVIIGGFITGLNLVLISHLSKAVMKTADYCRIIAEKE